MARLRKSSFVWLKRLNHQGNFWLHWGCSKENRICIGSLSQGLKQSSICISCIFDEKVPMVPSKDLRIPKLQKTRAWNQGNFHSVTSGLRTKACKVKSWTFIINLARDFTQQGSKLSSRSLAWRTHYKKHIHECSNGPDCLIPRNSKCSHSKEFPNQMAWWSIQRTFDSRSPR